MIVKTQNRILEENKECSMFEVIYRLGINFMHEKSIYIWPEICICPFKTLVQGVDIFKLLVRYLLARVGVSAPVEPPCLAHARG